LNRNVVRLCAAQNLVNKIGGPPKQSREIGSIGHQPSCLHIVFISVHGRQPGAQLTVKPAARLVGLDPYQGSQKAAVPTHTADGPLSGGVWSQNLMGSGLKTSPGALQMAAHAQADDLRGTIGLHQVPAFRASASDAR